MTLFLLTIAGLSPLLFLGFFGTQAIRLLRETWDGVVRADPATGNIRPYGATNLAEELFAMLDDDIPQTNNAPVTINVPDEGNGLEINSGGGSDSPGNAFTVNGGNVSIQGQPGVPSTITIGRAPLPGVPGDTVVINGSNLGLGPITVTTPLGGSPVVDIPGTEGGGGGGIAGTSSFLGKIVSGEGDTYRVSLYPQGPEATAGPTVEATVPQIDPNEKIPAGTWIAAVHEFSVTGQGGEPVLAYSFQPPVWLGVADA